MKLRQHVGHLVAALAAADVDDDVRFGESRERLLDHRLAGAEATREGHRPPFGDGEEQIEDALTRDEGPVGGQPAGHGPRPAYGPAMREGQRCAVAESAKGIVDPIRSVPDLGDLSLAAWRQQDAVLARASFVHDAEHVAAANGITRSKAGAELPARRRCQSRGLATGGEEVAVLEGERAQRPPDAVEHRAQQARSELRGERLSGAHHRLAHREPARLLEDLDGGGLSLDAYHLAHEAALAHAHQLVERAGGQGRDLGEGAHHAYESRLAHRRRTR
jgi:hypothetical protein